MEKTSSSISIFSTDVAHSYPHSRETTKEIVKRSVLFNILPIKSRRGMRKSISVSKRESIEEHDEYEESETAMLSEDFSSSSDEEDVEHGHVNISFESDLDSHVVLYKTFGRRGTKGGHLKDGPGVQFLEKGKCIVSDLLNCRLMIFSKSGKNMATIQNDDTIEPWGIAVHAGIILATSRRKRIVIKLSEAGDCEESSFGESFFQNPCGVAVTKDHTIVVTDTISRRVSVHEWSGNWIKDLVIPHDIAHFKFPRYVTVSPLGDIIISDSGNHCIYIFSQNGYFKKSFGSYGSNDGQLKSPYGVCCDMLGNIFVADHYNDRISFFTQDGEFILHIVTKRDGLFHPQGVSVSPDMKLYVTHGSLKACEVKTFVMVSKSKGQNDAPVFHI